MDFLADARRRAFSLWLRTGRLPRWARAQPAERKYNPWHDQDDGRFTFAGTGRYFGRGSAGSARSRSLDVAMGERPRDEGFGGFAGGGPGFDGGGTTGREEAFPDTPWRPDRAQKPPRQPTRRPAGKTPQATLDRYARIGQELRANRNSPKNRRQVEANGYVYTLDDRGLFREVRGTLTLGEISLRSRNLQLQAGGRDRRSDDDGGHYIAPRFNGPTQTLNHFAQNANFNRGRYRVLEEQWARELRAGKRVDVRIVAVYPGSSQRPSHLNVSFWINGERQSLRFPNERTETTRAKR